MAHCQIAVIGAGPYGLSLAAKLHAARADFVLFGRVMSFWQEHAAKGTCLLSDPVSCSFSDQQSGFDWHGYERLLEVSLPRPLQADHFIDYGLWFQRNTCPEPDPRTVVSVTHGNGRFTIRVDDGEEIIANQLVVAIGLRAFAFWPSQFAEMPRRFVSHTSDLHDLAGFSGKKVVVIGGGQSAIDCAALLGEQNAEVAVLLRSPSLIWVPGPPLLGDLTGSSSAKQGLRARIRGSLNQPGTFKWLPSFARAYWLKRMLRSLPSARLKPRLSAVQFGLGRTIQSARVNGDRIELCLDDGSRRTADHVVLGTGYRVNLDAIPFLGPDLRVRITAHHGYPVLNRNMESSVPSLYFTGAAAAWNFGPLMLFVRGAPWAAGTICSSLLAS